MTPRAQLRMLTVVAYVTLALAMVILALTLMSEAQALGLQPWNPSAPWTITLPAEKNVWFLVSFAGVAQAFTQYFRTRAAWRTMALDGDAEVMPLALPTLILGSGEQIEIAPTPAPISLRWELTMHGRTVKVTWWCILAAIGFGFAALLFWLLSALPSPDEPFNLLLPATGIALTLLGLVALMLALLAVLRGPVGVRADSAGISQWTPLGGHGIFIPWRDSRLLEASWFAVAREQLVPYIRVYRADGSSIGWPLLDIATAGENPNYHMLESADEKVTAASYALVRLATTGSGLPIRTTHRSLTDPTFKLEQEIAGPVRGLPGYLVMVLSVAALGVAILAYHWDGALWLNVAAAIGLGLCATRLAYGYVREVLVVPRTLVESGKDEAPRKRLLWPSLLTVSSALALMASIASVVQGLAPHDIWTNVEVIGGAAIFALGGALMAWARMTADDDPRLLEAQERLRAGAPEPV